MWFRPVIAKWGPAELASDLDLPTKNVRRWIDLDSIPAEWFAPMARAAVARGFREITVEMLAARAEGRGVAARAAKAAAHDQPAAA